MPNGATRSPDASFVSKERLALVPADRLERFLPLCPDFVVEVRSASARLRDQVEKMTDYMENGAQMAWLIDPLERRVYIFRPGAKTEVLEDPAVVSGNPELPGFELKMVQVW